VGGVRASERRRFWRAGARASEAGCEELSPRAALASAERYMMEGAPQFALSNAKTAMAGLPEYSPDWIRAQDINMVAEAKLAQLKKTRR
jgi:predicted Zn-dependent protease